jgi:protein-S-isoprenylcysteine O-methyltransferase Ste14
MTDLGLGPSFVGLLASLWSQSAMSESLRIGVHPSERTVLVTTGPFRRVRNPIYSAMLLYVVGVAALIPVARASSLSGFSRSQSYLAASHGRSYTSYAARVGRFVPGVGKFNPPTA